SLSADGYYLLSGGDDKKVRLWSVEDGREIKPFQEINYTSQSGAPIELQVTCVAFSPASRHAVSGTWDSAWRWDLDSGHEQYPFYGLGQDIGWVTSVSFSPDGRYLLSGSGDTVRLWETENQRQLRCFKGHTADVRSVGFSLNGRYALSGSWDNTVRV